MSEEVVETNLRADIKREPNTRKKRDIFRFCGSYDMAINLEYVYKMVQEGQRITFQGTSADFIEFEDEESAKKAFEQILSVWSANVLE